MTKRRPANARRTRRTRPLQVSRPLGWLLSVASLNAAATDQKIEAVNGFTTVTNTGTNIHEVTNHHASGGVAINVFNHFVVGNGNTVNLMVPAGSSQLVNIVRSSRPEVWGVLNAYQNGTLGGDVTFASADGFLVGAGGVVNVGKLTLRTPSASDITDFVSGNKPIGDLASGTYALSGTGLVSIQGKVNTRDGLAVHADQFHVSAQGRVIGGNAHGASYVNDAAVNTGDLSAPKTLQQNGGTIAIVAQGSAGTAVDVAGQLLADGGITIEAPTIALTSGSVADTRRTGSGTATGDITLLANAEHKVSYGQATANTSITLNGTAHAANFSARSRSHARASYSDEWGHWLGMTTVGALGGINANAVMADADSTLTVEAQADIRASGTLELSSIARSSAEDPAITLNGNSLIGAAVVYGKSTADSSTVVNSGAKLTATGALSVTARNENYLNVSALTLVNTNENTAVVAVAVGDASSHAKAKVQTGATISAGSLAVTAENQNSFYVSSSAYGLSGTALGVAFSMGDLTTSAVADLGASVGTDASKVGDVTVLALDRTTQQRVHSSATVGKSLVMRTVAQAPLAALGAVQTAVNNTVASMLPVNAAKDLARNEDGSLDFRVGASFTLAKSDHEAVAHIGNNVANSAAPTIVSSGNVVVAGRTDVREMRTTSESAVSARTEKGTGTPNDPEVENSGSIAINLALGDTRAFAEIGDYTTVKAARIGVNAQQWQPLVSTYHRWEKLGDFIDRVNATAGLSTSLLSSYANATGEAEENSIAFSFNYQGLGHDAKAWVGSRAQLTTTGSTADWSHGHTLSAIGNLFDNQSYSFSFSGAIGVHAYNQAQSIDIAGNVGALLILAGGGSGEDGKSLGASVSYVDYSGNTVAGVGSGATLNAGAGDVAVTASSDDSHIVITPTSGVGSGLAFNGIVGVLSLDNQTRASIHHSASLNSAAVELQAQQYLGNWAGAGSFAYTDSKAMGIAVAINDARSDTRATIGDNSADDALLQRPDEVATTASGTAPTAGITTDKLSVKASTDGTSGAIAAAGAATTPKTGEPGYGAQAEAKWKELEAKAKSWFGKASGSGSASSAGGAGKSGQQGGGDDGDSVAKDPGFGLAASGSLAASITDLDTRASVSGVTVTARTTASAIDVQALEKTVAIGAAGSAAFIKAGQQPPSSSTAFSGAVAYLLSGNDSQALVSGVTANNTGNVSVQAAQGGERLGLGLGLSANTNNASGKNYSVGTSASVAQVNDSASARVENSTLDATQTSATLDVDAYSRTDIGVGGGSLYYGGKAGMGLAITYAEIGNGERDKTEAKVSGSTLRDFGSVDISARNASRIGSGAAGAGGGSGTDGFAGSFVINQVDAAHRATLDGGTHTSLGALKLDVRGEVDTSLDGKLDALGSGTEDGTYDFSGSLVDEGGLHGSTGARVIGVAGLVQAGKNNVGLSYVHNQVAQTHEAAISGATVSATSVSVNAQDETWATAVAAGVGAGTGSLSGVGSVAVNEVNNRLTARVGTWGAGTASGALTTGSLSVTAKNRADIAAAAGAVALSKGSSGGLAVALNLIGTDQHATRAHIAWTDVYTTGDVTVSATSGTSGDANSLTAIAIGASLAQGGVAFAGAIGVNNVDQTVDAAVQAVGTTQGSTTYRAGTVSITAADHSDSHAWGFMAAGSQGAGAGAVGVATNRIDSDVTAQLLGGRGTTLYANSVLIDAARYNELLTINAGLAGSSGISGAASIGTNVTDGHVSAKIGSAAKVDALNHVKVSALADTFSAVGSGAVGVGTGAASGALAVSTAVDFGVTEALVEDSEVKALGRSGSVNIRSGELTGGPSLSDLSGSANGVDRDALNQRFEDQTLQEGAESVKGLAVNATSYQKQRTINAAGAGGTGAAAGALNVATNDFEGSTTAAIRNSTINSGVSGEAGADVTVRASDHSMGLAISAGLAGASQGAGIAGLSMNLQTHDVQAIVEGSTVRADALAVDATATQTAQAVAAGGSGGGTGAGAASVVVTTQYGDVNAWLKGGTTTAGSVAVTAERQQQSDVAAGAAAGAGQVGVGFGLAVSRIGGNTWATIGRDPSNDSAVTTTTVNAGAVTVDAARSTVVNSYTFGAGIGIGGAGIAGMVNISDQAGDTRAGVYGTKLRAADGSNAAGALTISADEIYSAEQHAAGAGVGLTGIGATFNVVLSSSSTVAELVGSDVKATTTTIAATADREAFATSVAGGAGKFAGAVSLGFIKLGAGDSGGADSELAKSAAAADTTINSGHGNSNSELSADEKARLNAQSGGLNVSSRVDDTGVSADATTTGDGQTLKVPNASLLAARVSGGTLVTDTLSVSSEGRTHTYTVAGAVQGSLAGLSGGLGITRQYLVNSAIVDGNVSADRVAVSATERDGAGGAAGEIEAFTAGVGGLVIGVAYSDVLVQNRVVAGVSRAIGDDTGALAVSARDLSSVKVGGDNEDSPENVSLGLGVIGASVVRAEKDSDVDAWAGKSGSKLDGYNAIAVDAAVSGQVKATGFSVTAGAINVTGVSTNAEDNSSADAQLIGGADTGSTGTLSVTASARPETHARSYGVAVAAGASVGGSFAYATANTSATASIADSAVFSGSGTVNVNASTGETDSAKQGSYFSADAKALAASGGLLLGLAGTEVTAKNSSQTVAKVGNAVTLPTGDLTVSALGYSGQRADGDAYFGGILGFGGNTATAWSATSTRVLVGSNPVANATRAGDLNLVAVGVDRNEAFATGGGGGAVSGSAADAIVKATDTDQAPAVLVQVADWTSSRNIVGTGGLKILAEHSTQFFGGADTTAVSVVGASAARSTTTIDVDAKVQLGTYVAFDSQAIDIAAVNTIDQIASPSRSGWNASVNAGAGGGLNGYAADSTINISNQGASISLGDRASLDVFALSAHDTLGNRLRLDAYSTLNILDTAKISTGGAIQRADAGSTITAVANNSITLGQHVELDNDVDKVQLGTYALQNVWATTNAKTYGAVGGAAGEAKIDSTVNNSVTLGSNAVISGYGSVSVYAGRSADSITDNTVLLSAVSDVYNWTASAITTTVKADANAKVNNNINIGNGASVASVRNIWLQADEGRVYTTGTGRGHNPYLELFSTEIKAGSGTSTTSSTITFDGTASIEAGTRHSQSVTIASNGTVTKGTGTEATVYDLANFSSRASLQSYIDTLTAEKKVTDDYVATLDADAQASYTYSARYQEVASQLSFLEPLLSELSNSTVNAVVVGGITAAGGDVHLNADTVKVNSGTPTITAHGDPSITITNNSAKALIVDTLTIPNDAGGQVLVTGASANSLPSALKLVQGGNGNGSQITITHNPGVDGVDLVVQGDITNLGGKVTVDVKQGSMLQTSSIYAKQMELTVADVYLVNTTGMVTYGFSPLALSGYATSSRGWKPASAEEAVMWYVSDRYQSEIKSKGIDGFNAWFYGTDYKTYAEGATIWSNIYLNWGFNDADECTGSGCTTFVFPNNSGGSTRGTGEWGFKSFTDYTGKLKITTDYNTVKNSGFLGTAVTKDALNASFIAVNAGTIDINGTIRAGNFNNWSVNIGSGFDAAIATYIDKKGLKAGDTVSITPGQPLYYTDKVWTCAFGNLLCSWKNTTVALNTAVSLANAGDAGIGLSYDVASGKLALNDVNASGNGTVMLRGKIVSTGADGKILIDDGLGTIGVTNASGKQLVVNDLNAGTQSTGVIRITDTNYSNRTDWYVHTPGGLVKHYVTGSTATTYTGVTPTTEGWWESGNATTSYQPKTGQWYKWSESTEVQRSYTAPPDGWLSKYLPTGEWKWTNQDTPWTVGSGSIVTSCSSCGSDYLTGVFKYGATTGYDAWGIDWTYSDYYGSSFVKRDWVYYIPTGLKMSADYYVKADHPVKLQFIGASQGTVSVSSAPTVTLNGTISNSAGTTTVRSTGGDIAASTGAVINSNSLILSAAGQLGSSTQAVSAITGQINASAGGTVNLDLTAQSSSILLEKIAGGSDVTVAVDKSLLATGSGTHLSGRNVTLNSSFGGLGDVSAGNTVNTSISGTLTVDTRGDIALRQASGNLTVNTLTAEAGDISITVDNGRLLNAIDSGGRTAEESAYLAQVWQRLNLTGADAGQETVKAFENQVSAKYQQYHLIKQRLLDDSDAGFTIAPAYLEAMRTRVALQQGVSPASVSDAALTAAVKAEYQGVRSFFSSQFGSDLPFDTAAAYNSGWRYTLDPASAIYATLTSGAKWKQSQLEVAISEAALSPVTTGYISSRAANISGNNVTLNIGQGSVGEDASSLNITISRTNPVLTDAEKAALVTAGPGDLSFATTSSHLVATVKQQDPLKVNATGQLKVNARNEVYIESDRGLTLNGVQSTQGDVRLSAGGSLQSATGTATTISAAGLNLAVTQGSIGTAAAPINLALTQALRVASAPGDIHLNHAGGALALGSIGAGGTLSVSAGGALTNWSSNGSGAHLLAESATLSAVSGSLRQDIGTSARPLVLRLTGGTLALVADDAYLDVDSGGAWSLGAVSLSGAMAMDTTGDLTLTGALSAASAQLGTSGNLSATSAARWSTVGATTLQGASLSLAAGQFSASQLSLQAVAGGLDAGALSATTGGVTLLATGDIGLHGALQARTGLLIDGQSLTMAPGSTATVTHGNAVLSAVGNVGLTQFSASGDVSLSGRDLSLSQQLQGRNLTLVGGGVELAAGSSMLAAQALSLNAQQILMGSGSLLRSGADMALTSTGNATLARLQVGGALSLHSGGAGVLGEQALLQGDAVFLARSLQLAGPVEAHANLHLAADETVAFDGRVQARELTVEATAVTVAAGAAVSATDAVTVDAGSLNMSSGSSIAAAGELRVTTTGDQVLAGLQAGGQLWSTAQGAVALNGQVQAGQSLALVAAGPLTVAADVAVSAGDALSLRAGSIVAGTGSQLAAGGDIALRSADAATLARVQSGGAFTLEAAGAVHLGGPVAVQGDAAHEARSLVVDGLVTVAGALSIDAQQALVVNRDLQARSVAVAAHSVGVADNVIVQAVDAAHAHVDTLTMGAGSRWVSGANTTMGATGAVQLAQIQVGGDLSLQSGAAVTLGEQVAVQGNAAFTVRSLQVEAGLGVDGAVQIDAVDQVALNGDVRGHQVTLDAAALTMAAGVTLTASDAVVLNAGSMAMGGGSAVDAGGELRIATTEDQVLARLQAGGDLKTAAGGSITVNEQVLASGSLTLNAGGAAQLRDEVSVQGDTAITARSLVVDGPMSVAGALSIDAAQAVALNRDVQAQSLSISAESVGIADRVAVQATDAAEARVGTLTMGAGSRWVSGADTTLVSTGALQLAQVQVGGALALQAAGAATLAEQVAVQGNATFAVKSLQVEGDLGVDGAVQIDATEQVALNADVRGHQLMLDTATLGITGGVTLAASDEVTVNAGSMTMGGGSAVDAGGELRITTADDQVLARLQAGGDLKTAAGGSITVNEQVLASGSLTLNAGGAAQLHDEVSVQGGAAITARSLVVDGPMSVAGALSIDAAQAVALNRDVQAQSLSISADSVGIADRVAVQATDAAEARVGTLTMGAGSRWVSGADTTLVSAGAVQLAQVQVSGDLTLHAGGAATLAEQVAVQGNAAFTVKSLQVEGGLGVDGAVRIDAVEQVALNAGVRGHQVTLDAAALTMATGVTLSASDAVSLNAGSMTMGSGSAVDAGGELRITTADDQVLARLQAGGDLKTAAGGSITVNEQVLAGGSLTLNAGGAAQLRDEVSVQGDAAITARSLVGDGPVSVAGALSIDAAQAVALNRDVQAQSLSISADSVGIADGVAVEATDAAEARVGALTMGAGSRWVSGTDTTLVSAGAVQLAQVQVGGDLTLHAGGAATLAEQVAVQGNAAFTVKSLQVEGGLGVDGAVQIDAAEQVALKADVRGHQLTLDAAALTMAAGVTLAASDAVTVNAGSMTMGGGSAVNAGGELRITTADDQVLARVQAGGDLKTAAGGAITANEQVLAGGSLTLNAGGAAQVRDEVSVQGGAALTARSLVVDGPMSVAGALSIDAAQAVALNRDVQAQSLSISADSLGIADRVAVEATDAAEARVGTLTMGAGSRWVSGADTTLVSAGPVQLAQVQVGGDLVLQAGGAATLAEQVAVQGNAAFSVKSLQVEGGLGVDGAVQIDATEQVALNADVRGHQVTLDAAALTMAAGVTLTASDAVSLNAGSIAMGGGSVVNAGGELRITTADDQVLARLQAGGDLKTAAGGSITANEQVLASSSLTLNAGGAAQLRDEVSVRGDAAITARSLVVEGPVSVVGDLSIEAAQAVALNRDVQAQSLSISADSVGIADRVAVQATDAAEARVGTLTMGAGSRWVSGADTSLVSAGAVQLAQVQVGGDLALQAAGAATLAEQVSVQGNAAFTVKSLQVEGALGVDGTVQIDAAEQVALNADVRGHQLTLDAAALTMAAGVTLTASDAVSLKAGSMAMGGGSALDAGGELRIDTTKDQVLALLQAGGDLKTAAGGAITLNEQVQTGGNLALNAGGAAQLNDQIAVRGDATLAAASVTVDGAIEVSGALSIDAQHAVAVNRQVEAQSLSVTSGSLSIAAGMGVLVRGDAIVDTGALTMGAGSALQTAGDLSMTGTGALNLAQLRVGGQLALDAGDAVVLADRVTVQGDAKVRSGNSVTIDGSSAVQGALLLEAVGGLTLNADVQAREIAIDAASLNMKAGTSLQAAGMATIQTQGSQTLAALRTGDALVLNAGGDLRLNDQLVVGGDGSVQVQGAASLAAGQRAELRGKLSLQGDRWTMEHGSMLRTGSDATVRTRGELRMAQADIGASLDLQAGGDLSLTMAATAAGKVSLDTAGALDLQAELHAGGNMAARSVGGTRVADGVRLQVAGRFDAQAAQWQMGAGSTLQVEGDLRLTAAGDVTLAAVTGNGGVIAVEAGGALRGRSDAAVHLRTDGATTRGELKAGVGIGNPLVVDLPWLSVLTGQGDVHLVVERDLYSPLISAANGNVTMTVRGSLSFEHLLGNPSLWVDGRLTGDRMTMQHGTLAARDALAVRQVTLNGGGPLTVAAPQVDLAIEAVNAPVTTLTLTGFGGARADNIAVRVQGSPLVDVTKLHARNGQLVLPMDLALRDASASGALTITTQTVSLSLDNVNPGARPADAQLITPNDRFWLQIVGNGLFTDALVTRFQSPVALYFHRADDQRVGAQQAFYRLSTEHLAQEVAGSSMRQPLPSQGPQPTRALQRLFGGAPAVGLEGFAPPSAGPDGEQQEEEDIVISAAEAP